MRARFMASLRRSTSALRLCSFAGGEMTANSCMDAVTGDTIDITRMCFAAWKSSASSSIIERLATREARGTAVRGLRGSGASSSEAA